MPEVARLTVAGFQLNSGIVRGQGGQHREPLPLLKSLETGSASGIVTVVVEGFAEVIQHRDVDRLAVIGHGHGSSPGGHFDVRRSPRQCPPNPLDEVVLGALKAAGRELSQLGININ